MNIRKLHPFFVLCAFLFLTAASACKPKSAENPVPAVEKTDACKLQPQHQYEVIVPAHAPSVQKFPLLIVLDPHGSGKTALAQFRQASRSYPVIVVASDLIRNNMEGCNEAIQNLIDDVRQKYPVTENTFLAGFSGGARMALDYAATHPTVSGVLACGALANPEQLQRISCPVFSISGTDDFNFIETAQYLFQEESLPSNLKIELTEGSHQWPDSGLLSQCTGFLQLSRQAVVTEQLTAFSAIQRMRIDSLKTAGALLKAVIAARNLASTEPFNKDEKFAELYAALKAESAYASELNILKDQLQQELSLRQPYFEALQKQGPLWWKREIGIIDESIRKAKSAAEKDTWLRVRGFLGVACYSLCNQAVQQHNQPALKQVLMVYEMLEPENPDKINFAAISKQWDTAPAENSNL